MNVAVLAKQVPVPESLELGPDGRLRRDGVALEMNAYCRRAVTTGVTLAAEGGGRCTVFTLGPESAEDVLREAVAWGADDGVLVSDPAFAGSDTLATARALAAAVVGEGPFDLVLVGRNSIDADTGQVGPEVAELLGLPFAGSVRRLAIDGGTASVRCELDDGWREALVPLPAVLSTAERLCEPAKVAPEGRAAVPAHRLRRLRAADLGPGPFGVAASRTVVGRVRVMEVDRRRLVLDGDVASQAARAAELLVEWGAVSAEVERAGGGGAPGASADSEDPVAAPTDGPGGAVTVVIEPGRPRAARELLGEAAQLAAHLGGSVVAFDAAGLSPGDLWRWGAEVVVPAPGAGEEAVSSALAAWCRSEAPWAVLVPGTLWGREVAARASAGLDAGLVGDAVGFSVDGGRLVSWKPAFGGRLVAAVTATSPVQLATARPGVMALRRPRRGGPAEVRAAVVAPRRARVTVLEEHRDDDVEALVAARAVVGVGAGVDPADLGELDGLRRARQIGITGHSIAPALYVAVGISGKFNHMVGAQGAGTIVAVNRDRSAPVFDWVDVGIVADWHQAVPLLAGAIGAAIGRQASPTSA